MPSSAVGKAVESAIASVLGDGTHALPMAVVMATLPLAGLACPLVLARPSVARTVPLDAKEVVERLG